MKQEAPFVIERVYKAPVELVWQAITDAGKMKHWYFDLPGFKAEVGYTFSFYGGTEEEQFKHLCEVTEVIPGRKLTYSWRYDGYEGISYVTFELFTEGKNTRLKLTHAGLDSFPPETAFARGNFEAGWNMIIGTSLQKFLES